ncbi:hypothetical protein Pfo_021710 [Paulownia fortunei]|nr:hypothetical protein Pfo_021710 [Paulownia fortunei]
MMVYYNLSELIPEEDGVDHFQYFVKIKDEIENRMNILETKLYQGVMDSVLEGETRRSEVGKVIILSKSFIGDPRDIHLRYLDALALIQRFESFGSIYYIELQFRVERDIRKTPEYKITILDHFDRFVCVELLNQEKYPKLYDLVVKQLMHGPCGNKNLNNYCIVDGKCIYCESTIQGKDGCPVYRRRKNILISNSYNWTIIVTMVKYLYTYTYKGNDKQLSAQEVIWRIFELNLNDIYPTVINFWDHVSITMVTRYFFMCSKNEKARKYLHQEFSEHSNIVVIELNMKNPTECEIYYLSSSFKEIEPKRGFLESDLTVIECLNEAVTFQIQHELQRLFAIILVYCAPTDVKRTLLGNFRSRNLITFANTTSTIENIDKLLKDIMKNDENFENTLSRNMNSRNDPSFIEFLFRVGNGEEPNDTKGNIKILKEMIIEYDNEKDTIQRLIKDIFLTLNMNVYSAHNMTRQAILAAKNEHVDRLNDKLIFIFSGEIRTFNNFDEVIDDINNYYEKNFVNCLTPNSLPLYKNLDPLNGLCNDTTMIACLIHQCLTSIKQVIY